MTEGLESIRSAALVGESISRIEAELLGLPQVVAPLVHHFAPGVYAREICMPAGSVIIGHEHTTEHLNIVLTGSAKVVSDGVLQEIKAPCVFKSSAGCRKALLVESEMRWITVHVTEETDLENLENTLIKKSEQFTAFYDAQKKEIK